MSAAARAGAVAGALVGVADALVATAGSGLAPGARAQLLALALGVGALIGAAAAAGFATLVGSLRRRLGGGDRGFHRRAGAVAAVVAAPFFLYDAFVAFTGPRAARIPGRHAIAIALAASAIATACLLGIVLSRLLARGDRRTNRIVAALAVLIALAVDVANRRVLPRLYEWFHVTLAVATFACALVGARFAWRWVRPSRRWFSIGLVAAVALTIVGSLGLVRRASLRFLVAERTTLLGRAVGRLPLGRWPGARARVAQPEGDPSSQSPLPDGPKRPGADVILISIDALRADHSSAYGYSRPTTPNLDALAKRGVRFDRAYAQAPHTSYSTSTMLTGKYFPTVLRVADAHPSDPLPHLLRRYGWKTAAFYPPAVFFVDADRLRAFADHRFQFEYVKEEFLDAFARVDQVATFLREEHPARLFLWLHLFEPHEPYEARSGHDFGPSDVDRYDSEIAYADAALGKLLRIIEKERPGAIVIVTADHGEEFDEHGGRYHGTSLHEEQIRVPLVIAVPGASAHVVEGPVELVDLAPTILGLLDIPAPPRMRGTDLGPFLGETPPPSSRLPPAFAELRDERAVLWGKDKLICQLARGYCRVYDLASDPGERRDLADARPEMVARLSGVLDRWLDDQARLERRADDAAQTNEVLTRARMGNAGVAPQLLPLLNSADDPAVRREAARLLARLPPRPDLGTALTGAMANADPMIAGWSAIAALRAGVTSAQPIVRRIAEAPPPADPVERERRVLASLALAAVGDAAGVPALADKVRACDSHIDCKKIIAALGALRDPRAVPTLIDQLGDVEHRRDLVEALGAVGDRRAVAALSERLAVDEYVPVRTAAAVALGRVGGLRARSALEQAARQEREAPVLAAIRQALAAPQGKVDPVTQSR